MMNILIVDDEEDIRDIISFAFEVEVEAKFSYASSGNEAIKFIEEKNDIDLIISDYNMPDGNGGDVYKHLLDNNLKIPYVLCSSTVPSEAKIFSTGEQLFGNIIKPNIFEGMQKILESYQEKIEKFSSASKEVKRNVSIYSGINIDLIKSIGLCPADIYLKINEDKYIKVLNAGNPFTLEDIEKYKEKDIKKLLIKKSDVKLVVEKLFSLIETILGDTTIQSETKVIDAHIVIMNTVRALGVSDRIVRATENSVSFALETFEKVKKFDDVYRKIFGNEKQYLTKHSIALSYITCGIISKLAWDSIENRNKLVLSSFLHDVTINSPVFDEGAAGVEDIENLVNFKDHPREAVELMRSFEKIPTDVDQIIIDHHEKPDGSGVPRGLTANQLKPLATIFIFSHDVVDAIFEVEKKKLDFNIENVLSLLDKDYYSVGHFKKCYEALEKLELFK
jgi:response regulator RpfG family c-di-GMP phosphodiesterase